MTQTETLISDLCAAGRQLDVIIQRVATSGVAGWTRFDVIQFASKSGYVFDKDGCPTKVQQKKATTPAARLDLQTDTPAPFVPSATPETPAAPVSPAPAQQAPTELADLVNRCLTSPVKAVARSAAKAREALDRLLEVLDEQDRALAESRAKEAATARARAEVERLERQLREARLALRGGSRVPKPISTNPEALSGAKGAGLDPKVVRTWAAANGVPCNQGGRIQSAVVRAYLAAQVTT